jgi:hypothetical protein
MTPCDMSFLVPARPGLAGAFAHALSGASSRWVRARGGEHVGERAGETWSTEPMLRRVGSGREVEGRMGDERRHGARGGTRKTSEVRAG